MYRFRWSLFGKTNEWDMCVYQVFVIIDYFPSFGLTDKETKCT
mgnify:CR=1 FL=1